MAINEAAEAAALANMVKGGESKLLAAAQAERAKDPEMTTEAGPATARAADKHSREGNPSSQPTAASVPSEPLSGETQPTPKQETATPSSETAKTIRLKVGDVEEEVPVDELGGIIERDRRVHTEQAAQVDSIARNMIRWLQDEAVDPALKQHVMEAIAEGKIPTVTAAETDAEELEPEERPAPRREGQQTKLEKRIEQLERDLQHRMLAERLQQREVQIAALMSKHDVFKDAATRDLALSTIRAELDARPDQDPKAFVQQTAVKYANWMSKVRQSDAPDAKARSGARTAPAGQTGASPAQGFTAKDLVNGGLLDHAVKRARELQR